jgi:hypothetical protein
MLPAYSQLAITRRIQLGGLGLTVTSWAWATRFQGGAVAAQVGRTLACDQGLPGAARSPSRSGTRPPTDGFRRLPVSLSIEPIEEAGMQDSARLEGSVALVTGGSPSPAGPNSAAPTSQ